MFKSVVFPFRLALATLYVQLGNMDDALALLEAEPNLSESERVGGTMEEGPGGGEESAVSMPKEQVNYFRVRTDLNDNFQQLFAGHPSLAAQVHFAGEQREAEGVCRSGGGTACLPVSRGPP